jgi:hypothetical protein
MTDSRACILQIVRLVSVMQNDEEQGDSIGGVNASSGVDM